MPSARSRHTAPRATVPRERLDRPHGLGWSSFQFWGVPWDFCLISGARASCPLDAADTASFPWTCFCALAGRLLRFRGSHFQHGVAEDDPVASASVAAVGEPQRQEPVARANATSTLTVPSCGRRCIRLSFSWPSTKTHRSAMPSALGTRLAGVGQAGHGPEPRRPHARVHLPHGLEVERDARVGVQAEQAAAARA